MNTSSFNHINNTIPFKNIKDLLLSSRIVNMSDCIKKTIDKVIDEFGLIIYNYGKNLSDNDFNNYLNLCESMKRFKLFLLDQVIHINVIDNFLRDRNRIFEVVDNSDNLSNEIIQLLNVLDLDNIYVKRSIESIVDKSRDKNYMKNEIIKIYYDDMNSAHDDFRQAINYFKGIVRRYWIDEETNKLMLLTITNFEIPKLLIKKIQTFENGNWITKQMLNFENGNYILQGKVIYSFKNINQITGENIKQSSVVSIGDSFLHFIIDMDQEFDSYYF